MPMATAFGCGSKSLRSADFAVSEPAVTMICASPSRQSLSAAELRDLEVLAYNLGDDVLTGRASIDVGHGLGRTRQEWFARGLSSADLATCNT